MKRLLCLAESAHVAYSWRNDVDTRQFTMHLYLGKPNILCKQVPLSISIINDGSYISTYFKEIVQHRFLFIFYNVFN